jgi:hypothetical protein
VLGVDVILTILCRFRQSLPKKISFYLKTNVTIQNLRKLARFWTNKLKKKNHNIGPLRFHFQAEINFFVSAAAASFFPSGIIHYPCSHLDPAPM